MYALRFLVPGQKQQVSHGGGIHPRWTTDGRELVYRAVLGGIDAVAFESEGSTFRIGARRTLVQAPVPTLIDGRTHYDVTRDGRVCSYGSQRDPRAPGITVILELDRADQGR